MSRPSEDITARVLSLAEECAALVGAGPIEADLLHVVDARDPDHGGTQAAPLQEAALGLHTEGLMLDPVYSARSFAATVDLLRHGTPGPLLYWHTGGIVPAISALTVDRAS